MTSRTLLLVTGFSTLVVLGACSDPVGPGNVLAGQHPSVSLDVQPGSQGPARKCDASDAAAAGALNMLQDPTMWTIPMARDAAQGNDGMFHAVGVSGC